jgi:hypothetical protein
MISDEGLGNIFLERTNLFKHYAHYCVNHISMSQKLAALRENHKIAEFLEVRASRCLRRTGVHRAQPLTHTRVLV